ncbi:MAG: HD domain-containing protein [Streptococcaceae bacterium]|jgi:3'-5' exoribonuclease|nr:HD domain-containing protein [Streptococcaceae bacterium]
MMVKMLNEIQVDENFETYVLIQSMDVRMTRAGKQYQAFTFQDRSSLISGNLWDTNEKTIREFTSGRVVYMTGRKELYQGMPQVNQIRLRVATSMEPNNPEDYKDKPPMKKGDLEKEINKRLFEITNANWQRIVRFLLNKYQEVFFAYPAAKSNHHVFETGLAFHTVSILRLAECIIELYPELNRSLLYAGVILHDLGKVLELTGPVGTEYTLAGNLLGHIVIIDEEITKAALELGIDDRKEDLLLLRHVVLAHHGLLEYGSPVRPKIMEAEVLHNIDNLDAAISMMTSAIKQVAKGEKTQRIFGLDNRNFYRPKN